MSMQALLRCTRLFQSTSSPGVCVEDGLKFTVRGLCKTTQCSGIQLLLSSNCHLQLSKPIGEMGLAKGKLASDSPGDSMVGAETSRPCLCC